MAGTDNWIPDTQATVLDGMNRGREPELISEQQAHLLRNISIRGGRARSRPRFVKRSDLPAGKLQGATVFKSISKLIVSVDGKVFELDPVTWEVSEKTAWLNPSDSSLSDDDKATLQDRRRNSLKQPRHYYCETVNSLVIQDGQSAPLLYDGSKIRRSGLDVYDNVVHDANGDPLIEVPVGTAMAYGNGRLAVVVNRGYDVRLGDIRQPSHQSELRFLETNSLNGGGDFSFPSLVKALAVLPVVDTGSGHGALIVGCVDQVSTLKTQITQRDLWQDVGFQTILLPTRGITGADAVIAVNQDLYFRSSDGLRSVRTSTADYDAPGLAPLSVEVRHRFDYDTPFLLEDAQVAYFDNRVLCTHAPFVYSNRSLAQGLIAFNFDALSGRGQKTPPAYDGEWDGVIVAAIAVGAVNGRERCFVIGRSATTGANAVYEMLPEIATDSSETVTQVLETRMLLGSGPGGLKALQRADLLFSDIRGALNVRVFFRPFKYPFWIKWDSWSIPAPSNAPAWGQVKHQYRELLQTTSPLQDIDQQTGRPVNVATGFQVRVEFDGNARLDYMQVFQSPFIGAPYAQNRDFQATDAVVTPPAYAIDPKFWYRQPVSPLAGLS